MKIAKKDPNMPIEIIRTAVADPSYQVKVDQTAIAMRVLCYNQYRQQRKNTLQQEFETISAQVITSMKCQLLLF